jgi:hypothetical protein
MKLQYNRYSRMPNILHDTFTSEDLIQAKQLFKQFTSYIPKTKENKFQYTGTEKNQILHERPNLQQSLISGLEVPIYEYIGRVKHIEPRQDYVVNVDMSSNAKQQFKKELGQIKIFNYFFLSLFIYIYGI